MSTIVGIHWNPLNCEFPYSVVLLPLTNISLPPIKLKHLMYPMNFLVRQKMESCFSSGKVLPDKKFCSFEIVVFRKGNRLPVVHVLENLNNLQAWLLFLGPAVQKQVSLTLGNSKFKANFSGDYL